MRNLEDISLWNELVAKNEEKNTCSCEMRTRSLSDPNGVLITTGEFGVKFLLHSGTAWYYTVQFLYLSL